MIKSVVSRENEYFKLARSLGTSRGIRESGLFAIEGPKMLDEALQTNAQVHSAVFGSKSADRLSALIRTCEERNIPVYTMPEAMISQICSTETPQGLFALVKAPTLALPDTLEKLGNRIIALDGVQDPGNMGTILRCAAAFACSSVVLGKGCAHPLNPKTVRASMGAIFRIPVYECEDLPGSIQQLRHIGCEIIGGHLAGAAERPRPAGRAMLVIGNESHGISAGVEARCTTLWRLDMPGQMESLNASVAAGIMMYELFARKD